MWTLRIGRRYRAPVADYEEASRLYAAQRDASGEGASTFPPATVTGVRGKVVARVSYNAKVWDRDGVCLFNPYQ